jgi:ABC-type branched-subunit amino acid transport system substrate-binding protein
MTERKPRSIEPYKIGVMVDLPDSPGLSDMFVLALEFAFEEALEQGVVDRPVELCLREYVSHPWRDGFPNIEAYHDLVHDEKVLGIAGPMTTDNCLAVLPEVEKLGVPNITICGTQLYVGRYAFNLSNGGMGDEPAVIAAWIAGEGHKKVAVYKDFPSQIGEEYSQYFRYSAAMHGLSIVMEVPVSPIAEVEELAEAFATLKEARPDVVVYLGLGGLCRIGNEAFRKVDWLPPRIACTAFVGATYSEQYARELEGWVGVDQYDERNTVLSHMLERYRAKHADRELVPNSATSCGYDIGRALGLGLGRMRIATPEGLRAALETIRRLPAATGAPGTVITFGPEDHRGFKGADFLNLRRAENGTTVLVGTAPVE